MTEQKLEHNTIKERAKKKLERDMGPELLAALNDPKTVEIMLNADGKVWQEKLGEPMKCIGTLRVAQDEAKALLAKDPNLIDPAHRALSDEVERLFETAGAMN